MRLRLLARFRRRARRARPAGPGSGLARRPEAALVPVPAVGRHRRDDRAQVTSSRPPAPASQPSPAVAPFASPVSQARPRRPPRSDVARRVSGHRLGAARAAVQAKPGRAAEPRTVSALAAQRRAELAAATAPWYQVPQARRAAEGHRDCGPLERVLIREWEQGTLPPPEVLRAVDRLADLPRSITEKLAAGLDAIYLGPGGVPDLDHMGRLKGVALPSGRATWDACAGAYGERKIIIGTRPSAAPDVVCHEVGHALDDIDGCEGRWQSDSDEFRTLYGRCLPRLVSDFHRQEGSLGRREFFADAFAAIASSQRPALVDMLGGETRTALDVMLYFNKRYGI
jgi:hypothetical protein